MMAATSQPTFLKSFQRKSWKVLQTLDRCISVWALMRKCECGHWRFLYFLVKGRFDSKGSVPHLRFKTISWSWDLCLPRPGSTWVQSVANPHLSLSYWYSKMEEGHLHMGLRAWGWFFNGCANRTESSDFRDISDGPGHHSVPTDVLTVCPALRGIKEAKILFMSLSWSPA